MANVVGILIEGRDASQAAMQSAAAGLARLQTQTAAAMKSTALLHQGVGGLGRAMQATGAAAGVMGRQDLAGAASNIAALTMVGRESAAAFMAMEGALKRTVVGLVAVAGVWAYSKWEESQKAAEDAIESNKKLGEIARAADIRNMSLISSSKGAMMAENERYRKQLEFIDELEKKQGDAAAVQAARQQEEMRHNAEIFTIQQEEWKRQMDFKAQLNEAEKIGQIEHYVDLLDTEAALTQNAMANRQQYLQQYQDFWMESHRTMFSYAAEGSRMIAGGLSETVVDIAMGAKTAANAFADLGKQIARMFITWIANRAIAFAAEKAMALIGLGMAKAQAVSVAGIAAGVASSWAPAATASLIASYGASAALGSLLIPAMAANQIAASALAMGGAAIGQAHGGVEYVPQTQTVLLEQGERVVKRSQNERLMEVLDGEGGGAGGGMTVVINLDGDTIYRGIHQASRNGRLTINAKAIV